MVMAKAYQKYKDAKLTWLEKMPEGWQILRGKAVFRCIDMRSKDGSEELLSVSSKDGVVPRSSKKITMFMAESYAGYKLCWPGDLVINSLWAWMFGLGFSRHHGIVSSAYGVYRTRSQYLDHWQYFDYLIRSKAYAWELRVRSRGVWTSRLQMTDDRFLDMPILIPPKEEAIEIVKFLSVLDIQIRRYIREKQKVIKLLNEQRQSIINRAVTRGIDSNAKFKSSEIDWIGDVPDHWVVKPLKFWVKINQDVLSEDTDENFEFHYLDIGSVGTGILDRTPEKLIFGNAPSRARRILKEGDTIISTVRTYLKAVYFISQKTENLIASTGFAVLTPCANVYPEFLSLVIQSNSFVEQVTANSIGVTYPAIAETKLGALHIAMPPDMSEQVRIVEDIKSKTMTYDEMIAGLKNEIAFIDEYRTRLISDAVTGKIDVRDIKLPEIRDITDSESIEEQESLEDVEDTEEVVNADE